MSEVFELLQYPFVQNLIIVLILVALCSSVLGVILVLKRYSYLGDGLSHVAFGAFSVASVLNVTNNMLIILPSTIIVSVLMMCYEGKRKTSGDAKIALVSVSCLAIGYMIMNLFPSSNSISGDVCTSLFGSAAILTLSRFDVIFTVVLTILVLLYFVLFYHKIFATTFDADFAKATGTNTTVYNILLSIIIAIIIVLGMKLVGSLLICALIVFPALASMRLFKSFKSVMISSLVFGVVTAFVGIFVSLWIDTPIGSTVVVSDIVGFVIFYVISLIK